MNTITLIKNARILTPSGFTVGNLLIKDGIIQSITKDAIVSENDVSNVLDAKLNMLIPGFIDIHTHGGNGLDVNSAVTDDYASLNQFFASLGTTSYVPTIITDSHETMSNAIKNIVEAKNIQFGGSQILGIHMEGPYLCHKYKGAMPEEYLRLPNIEEFDELQQTAKGNIIHITIAPELEGSVDFVREVAKSGVSVAVGHTEASYEQTMECIENGADHATHTFNAMKMMHHRGPAVLGAVLDSDVTAEIICDGEHVDPVMVRILKKIKGVDRLVAVTDSIMATGLPDGRYKLGVNDIDVENGNAWLTNEYSTRAGSVLVMIEAFRNMIEFTDISISDASKIFSRNPARVIGVDGSKGEIRVGMDADLILLDDDLNLTATIVLGNLCYEKEVVGESSVSVVSEQECNEGGYLLDSDVFKLY